MLDIYEHGPDYETKTLNYNMPRGAAVRNMRFSFVEVAWQAVRVVPPEIEFSTLVVVRPQRHPRVIPHHEVEYYTRVGGCDGEAFRALSANYDVAIDTCTDKSPDI